MSLSPYNPSRRRFLLTGATAASALVVGFGFNSFGVSSRLGQPSLVPVEPGQIALNAWLKIDTNGVVTVMVPRVEMGQGVHTALPMLVAEELGVAWQHIRVQLAGLERVYANVTVVEDGLPTDHRNDNPLIQLARTGLGSAAKVLNVHVTGGSSSVRDAWQPMREAGAAARQMLVAVAAEQWQLSPAQLDVEKGFVSFAPTQQKAAFGTLVAAAAKRQPPATIALSSLETPRILGTSPTRLDTPSKVTGAAKFGIDARPDGLVYAAIRQAPWLDGRSYSVDTTQAAQMPGVKGLVQLEGAVAVVASRYWHARAASKTVIFAADEISEPSTTTDNDTIVRALNDALEQSGATLYESRGDVAAAEHNQQVITATYAVPYLAHACIEPQNCTARVDQVSAELWVGHQAPSFVVGAVAAALGIASDAVVLHQHYLGGGFGRRLEVDVAVQAVTIAREFPGIPVQLIWSREEDTQHDFYRPAAMASMRAVLGANSGVASLRQRLACTSVSRAYVGRLAGFVGPEMPENANTDGARHVAYRIPNVRVEHAPVDLPVPIGFWRSVGYSQNGFFYEAFLDELAHHADRDPLAFRDALLNDRPRHREVLATLRELAQWQGANPRAGVGRGVAMVESFGSIVGLVVDVEVIEPGAVRVTRISCVADCGRLLHRGQVEAQMQGGIIFGLNAALFGRIDVNDGQVQQLDFDDYQVMRMSQVPPIDVQLVDSKLQPGGAGESGTPAAAPALVNAIFAATAKRIRTLPVIGSNLKLV